VVSLTYLSYSELIEFLKNLKYLSFIIFLVVLKFMCIKKQIIKNIKNKINGGLKNP